MTEEELEGLRKRSYLRYKITYLICGCVCLLSLLNFWRGWQNNEDYTFMEWGLFTLFVTGLLTVTAFVVSCFLVIRNTYEDFSVAYKERYVSSLIEESGGFHSLEYFPQKGYDFEELSNLFVVDCGAKNHYSSENMLTGCFHNIPFHFCDAASARGSRVGGLYSKNRIFCGQIIRFDGVPGLRENHSMLQVFQNERVACFNGHIVGHRIKTNDTEFDKRFQAYTTDPNQSILTPELMEKIKTFSNTLGKRFAVTFANSSIMIGVYRGESLFKAFVDKPISVQKEAILKDIGLLKTAGDIFLCL